MAQEGKRLLAVSEIYIGRGFIHFRPGDFLPDDHPNADAWVEAGSAKWVDADYQPPTYARATPAAAEAGLPGLAVGGEGAGDDLVGKIPRTPERGMRKWSL